MIRAIRLELVKPLSESWDSVGPLLRLLANATPKLMDAAYDALVGCQEHVAGKAAVKAVVSPDSKGTHPDTLAYQAVNRCAERLVEWGRGSKRADDVRGRYATLDVSSGSATTIARAASKAFGERHKKGRTKFTSERILIPAVDVQFAKDDQGYRLSARLRRKGRVEFACAHSWGSDAETRERIASGDWPHGACTIQYDAERRKWYALVSYEQPDAEPMSVDPARVLAVHRGIRNALYPILSSAERVKPFPGNTLVWRRRGLQARMRDARRGASEELGDGAKGHGRARRMERYGAVEDKLARVTHTWCQQAAAWVANQAVAHGCGMVVIEDYGGIAPAETRELRRVLERFPFHELKTAIANRLECVRRPDGSTVRVVLHEVRSAWISSTCPRCEEVDPRAHNTRTNAFHCAACGYERDADFVAAYWMLSQSGADMTRWSQKFELERRLAGAARNVKGAAAE